jgi:hypothetical protein
MLTLSNYWNRSRPRSATQRRLNDASKRGFDFVSGLRPIVDYIMRDLAHDSRRRFEECC